MTYIANLRFAIRDRYGCASVHVESVHVAVASDGSSVWQGLVEVFDLVGHPQAKLCYAWRIADDLKDGQPRIVTELGISPVDSPSDAVRRVEIIRRHMANAANNTFGLLDAQVLPVEGGWREARICDGEFVDWRCRHTHQTEEEAERCPEKRSILAAKSGA